MPVVIKIVPIKLPRGYPKSSFDKWDKAIKFYMSQPLAKMLVGDMYETVENWEHAPSFTGEFSEIYNGARYRLLVMPKGQYTTRWSRVSEGVQGHPITPKRRSVLRFREKYTPYTKPGGRWGGPGQRSGGYVRKLSVNWPGIEPRKFSRIIADRRTDKVIADINKITMEAFK